MIDRRVKLELIKLQGRCIRVGRVRTSGPIFYLADYDHSRDTFKARNTHNGTESKMTVEELHRAVSEGIAHVSKVGGLYFV